MKVPFLDLKAQYESIKSEIDHAIQQVLDSCAFAGGPFVQMFEKQFAEFCRCEYCIGVGSGTEALWLEVKPALGLSGDSIINQALPAGGEPDIEAEQEVAWVQAFIGGVRQIRGEMDIGFSRPLAVWLEGASQQDLRRVERYRNYLTRLARLDHIEPLAGRPTSGCAAALVGDLRLLVPLAGIKDLAAERERLNRAVEKVQQDLTKAEAKLGNASFIERAPAAVVAKERQRVMEMTSQVAKLTEQIQRLGA